MRGQREQHRTGRRWHRVALLWIIAATIAGCGKDETPREESPGGPSREDRVAIAKLRRLADTCERDLARAHRQADPAQLSRLRATRDEARDLADRMEAGRRVPRDRVDALLLAVRKEDNF